MNLETPPKKAQKPKKKSPSVNKSRLGGINKGVSHAIKKPKPSVNKKPVIASSEEDEEMESPKQAKTPKTPKLTDLITPKSTGKLSVSKDKSVCYDIKNGQMTFKYRRSPRKSPYFNKLRTPNR